MTSINRDAHLGHGGRSSKQDIRFVQFYSHVIHIKIKRKVIERGGGARLHINKTFKPLTEVIHTTPNSHHTNSVQVTFRTKQFLRTN